MRLTFNLSLSAGSEPEKPYVMSTDTAGGRPQGDVPTGPPIEGGSAKLEYQDTTHCGIDEHTFDRASVGPMVRDYCSKVSAYRTLKEIQREFVDEELPKVGYVEGPDGRCELVLWPKDGLPAGRKARLVAAMGSGREVEGDQAEALGRPGECREMFVGGIARVMRNLHW